MKTDLPSLLVVSTLTIDFEKWTNYAVSNKLASWVGAADSKELLEKQLITGNWQLLFLDLNLLGAATLEALELLNAKYGLPSVILYNVPNHTEFVKECYNYGIWGFLPENPQESEVHFAIQSVSGGRRYFSNAFESILLNTLVQNNRLSDPEPKLTETEKQMLLWLCERHREEELPQLLCLSEETVHRTLNHLKHKTNCSETDELILFAIEKKYYPVGVKS